MKTIVRFISFVSYILYVLAVFTIPNLELSVQLILIACGAPVLAMSLLMANFLK